MRIHNIAAIPGDGIGPEVIDAGLEVLDALAARDGSFQLKIARYDWSSDYYRKHGRFMPADALAWLRVSDAIYFGAVGAKVPTSIKDQPKLIRQASTEPQHGLRLSLCCASVQTQLISRMRLFIVSAT